MKEHGILFSAPMVQALLEGRKTMTRRIVTDRNSQGNAKASALDLSRAWVDPGPSPAGNPGPYLKAPVLPMRECVERLYPRLFPGDRLWVKETWNITHKGDLAPGETIGKTADQCAADNGGFGCACAAGVVYRADGVEFHPEFGKARWRPSIFMPRWASRITLEITDVHVERVQEISEEDAEAEGATPILVPPDGGSAPHVEGYRDLWDSINGAGAWDRNDWVWVYTFRRLEQEGGGNG